MSSMSKYQSAAVWLIQNTALSFDQIAQACHLHIFEVNTLANKDPRQLIYAASPIDKGWTTLDAIKKCENNPKCLLTLTEKEPLISAKQKNYVPASVRKNKPNGILWVLKHCPHMSDAAIVSLLSTTRKMIQSLRDGTHKKIDDFKPANPVSLGLCTQNQFDEKTKDISEV
jgi:hypothetical protein